MYIASMVFLYMHISKLACLKATAAYLFLIISLDVEKNDILYDDWWIKYTKLLYPDILKVSNKFHLYETKVKKFLKDWEYYEWFTLLKDIIIFFVIIDYEEKLHVDECFID